MIFMAGEMLLTMCALKLHHTFIFGCVEALEDEWAQQGQRPDSTKLQERTCGLPRGRHARQKHMRTQTSKCKKTNNKKPSVSIRHTFKFWESDPDCTRSERGTVGHSRCHLRLIPVTPKAMKITPRNKKICVERKSKYMTFINLNNLSRWCIFWKKLHSWMLTIPCEANVSRVVLVRQLGTVQRAVMNDFFY